LIEGVPLILQMPLTIPSAAVLLKEETALAHLESENILHPWITRIRSLEDYAGLLRVFYGYFHPLQTAISRYISVDILPDIRERRHASLIRKDLHALGENLGLAKCCTELPVIDNVARAFGALYVLEGSTLGGRVICRLLKNNQRVTITDAQLHFFSGYGVATGPKWQVFLEALHRQKDLDTLIASANATFRLFQKWIKHARDGEPLP
jgi:heme oxygenase